MQSLKEQIQYKEKTGSLIPITVVGTVTKFDEYFLDWLVDESNKNQIQFNENTHPEVLFESLKKIKGSHEHLFYVSGYEMALLDKEYVFIGMNISHFDENFSLKRIKIEVYNELLKLNYLNRDDDLDFLHIISDILIFDDKIKRLTKEDIDGLVQEDSKK
jgi:hypothetical protein